MCSFKAAALWKKYTTLNLGKQQGSQSLPAPFNLVDFFCYFLLTAEVHSEKFIPPFHSYKKSFRFLHFISKEL